MKHTLLSILCLAALATGHAAEPRKAFTPGEVWPDNNGVHINAHGGGMLFHQGTYYWFGEHKIEGGAGNVAHVGVHVYSSQDLYNWKDDGIALSVSNDPNSPITKGCIIERPKVIFNKQTGKFVMWFHHELLGKNYDASLSGVAVADKVTGPYTYIESFRPNAGAWPTNVPEEMKKTLSREESDMVAKAHMPGDSVPDPVKDLVFRRDHAGGQMARDMTLFVDDDGKAYHIYSSEANSTLHLSQLTDDFLKPAGKFIRVFPMRFNEAPAIFKHHGKYFLIASGCTGWSPNAARLASADKLAGPWTEHGNPCVGPADQIATTFQSQSTFVLPVQGQKDAFIFMADRWNPGNAIDGRYIWLPIQFNAEGLPFLAWHDKWDLGWTMGLLSPADWSAKWIGLAENSGKPDLNGVSVTKATYRTHDGKAEKDVTELMRRVVEEKKMPFAVDFNALGGDIAPNVVKELVVEYTKDGKTLISRANDFAQLSIPPVPAANAAPWFRGDFNLTETPQSATVTVHTHAYFELYINGTKIGDDVLTPAVSDPKSRTFTITYDVASLLKPGKNCVGLWLSKGWADRIAVRAQLDAVVGGKPFTFSTNTDWKTRPSGYSHIGGWSWGNFGGERMDAAAHLPGWCEPGIDTTSWSSVVEATAPAGPPVNLAGPHNRIGERIPAKEITTLADGRYAIDFGTNLTGWLRLKFPPLKAGQLVRLHFADRVFPDGVQATPIGNITISTNSCISCPRTEGGHNLYQIYNQTSEFVSAGSANEEFCHKFNYAGFRYVVIEGLTTAPRKEDATALLVESDLADAGTFECSDPLLNRIHQANRWTQRCLNLGSYYVDCPHRERMGYGDGQVALQGMMMNFNAAGFYSKWAQDWRLALEKKHESLPYIAPPFEKTGGGPPWPGGIARIPWQHYLHYGNPAILEENIDAARSYCEYLDGRSKDDVLRDWGGGFSFIGDWVPPGRGMDTNNWPSQQMAEFFCNCYRIHLWQIVGKMATALGRTSEADHARQRADAIGKATHAAYFDAANKRYVIDEQIYYAFPLMVGLTPEADRPAVLENLVRCIVEKNKGHLDTGMLGTMLLMEYLQEIGRDDLILGIYQKKDYPGWGYMVEQGATTLWEQWNGHWSQIHSCFTSADNWLYQGLAGIRPDPAQPGFKNVIIQPAITGDITWVKASHDGPYGRITSHWKRDAANVTLDITIPPNSTATVRLPGQQPKQVPSGTHRFQTNM